MCSACRAIPNSPEYTAALMQTRREKMGKDRVDHALQTLEADQRASPSPAGSPPSSPARASANGLTVPSPLNQPEPVPRLFLIGLDTGGTYTDAALLDTATGTVRVTGKSLTTRDDLSIGVGGAIQQVLEDFDGSAADIGLVSLSTTLATNAVVEGVGGRVGLLMIGFDEARCNAPTLRALGQDPAFFINGGHVVSGAADEAAIRKAVGATEAVPPMRLPGIRDPQSAWPCPRPASRPDRRTGDLQPRTLLIAWWPETCSDSGAECPPDQPSRQACRRHRRHHGRRRTPAR